MKSPTDSPFIRSFFFVIYFVSSASWVVTCFCFFFFLIFYQFLRFFCVLFYPITMICFELCVLLFHLLVRFFFNFPGVNLLMVSFGVRPVRIMLSFYL